MNLDLATQFAIGQHALRLGQCTAGDVVKDRVVNLMRIGLIQGTLRYAYIVGELGGTEKARAEGAVFAAGVLPALHKCSATAATTVYDNMKLGASSTSMAAVKRAFEVSLEPWHTPQWHIAAWWARLSLKLSAHPANPPRLATAGQL